MCGVGWGGWGGRGVGGGLRMNKRVRGEQGCVSAEEAGHLSEISSPVLLSPHFLGQEVESIPRPHGF